MQGRVCVSFTHDYIFNQCPSHRKLGKSGVEFTFHLIPLSGPTGARYANESVILMSCSREMGKSNEGGG
jgi:hypothetical protein